MQFSPILLATIALVYGAPIDVRAVQYNTGSTSAMTGVQGSVTNSRQVMDTLNNQLKTDNAHSNADRLVAYITGADSQIDNAIATVGEYLAPLTGGLSMQIADVILGPFVQSVTNGAEVLLANLVGGAEDRVDAVLVGQVTGDYSRLAELSSKYNVNTSKLQSLSEQIQNTLPKSKRDVPAAMPSSGEMEGVKGAMTNHEQFQDTLNKQLKSHDGHATADMLSYFIRGADSQIDNAAATIANGLDKYTFGLSGAIGDFLLGPFVQGITDGAETVIANVVGGSIDLVADGTAKLFSDSLAKLSNLAVKYKVSDSKVQALNKAIAQFNAVQPQPDSDSSDSSSDSSSSSN